MIIQSQANNNGLFTVTPTRDLFVLGHDSFGQNTLTFNEYEENRKSESQVAISVPSAVIQSGQLVQNLSMVAGYLQSANYISGNSGWRIDGAGNLEANNAVFRGTIIASSGTIGGFTITPTKLYGGIIQTGATVGTGSNGVIMDSSGVRGYSTVLGLVFDLPTDGSAPSFSSGIIENTIFEINTNAILRTSDTVGDGSADSAGILINNTGLYGCEANQSLSDANIKVLIDGTVVVKANIKGGQTDYNTGTGYFLGLSSGDYKLSIGDPAGNYLTWDGNYLKIKGSFDVGSGGLINNSSYTVANLPVAPTTVGFNVPSAYE